MSITVCIKTKHFVVHSPGVSSSSDTGRDGLSDRNFEEKSMLFSRLVLHELRRSEEKEERSISYALNVADKTVL
jgi:hypothetical protein